MIHRNIVGNNLQPFLLPGQCVTTGTYVDVESGRVVCVEGEDYLPATLNGKVACYVRVHPCLGEWIQASRSGAADRIITREDQ